MVIYWFQLELAVVVCSSELARSISIERTYAEPDATTMGSSASMAASTPSIMTLARRLHPKMGKEKEMRNIV